MSMRCRPADVVSARCNFCSDTDLLLIRSADGKTFYATEDDAGILMFLLKHSSYGPYSVELADRVLVCEWVYYDLIDVLRSIISSGFSFAVVQPADLKPPAPIIETNEDDKPAEASTEQQAEPALV